LAAVYVVLAVMTRPVLQNGLSVKPLLWLGRVSYSLYLVHIPVLFALFHGVGNRVSFALLAVAGLLITLTVAQTFHWLVEKPSLQLGRIVGQYFTPSVVPAPGVPRGL
jgi:peptidoglycan/LPS O-acetylase OafA/YrhL